MKIIITHDDGTVFSALTLQDARNAIKEIFEDKDDITYEDLIAELQELVAVDIEAISNKETEKDKEGWDLKEEMQKR